MEIDWVSARFSCSLRAVFGTLAEVIKTDAEVATKLLKPGRIFKVTVQPTKIIVARAECDAGTPENVVLELSSTAVTAKKGLTGGVLFEAKPALTKMANVCWK